MFVWRKHYSQFVTYFDVKIRIYITFLLFCDYGWAENLYDVFVNIRDDEAEHCKTMRACQVSHQQSPTRQKFSVQIHHSKLVVYFHPVLTKKAAETIGREGKLLWE
jgi:hypothetical protein